MARESFSLRLSVDMVRLVDKLCDRFECEWQEKKGSDEREQLEQYLDKVPVEYQDYLLQELVSIERHYRVSPSGDTATLSDMVEAYPALTAQLGAVWNREADLALSELSDTIIPHLGVTGSSINDKPLSDGLPSDALSSDVILADMHPSHGLHIRCPHCCHQVELLADTPYEDVTCNSCGSAFCLVDREASGDASTNRQTIGRFELISRLGLGGFGTVWKARDRDLQRTVALKIPRKGNLQSQDIDFFFREARAAAQLCHPHIATVHEIGRDGETIFIVSDFIRGITLTDWMVKHKANPREVAQLGSLIAEALEHAHQHGVIHRDLKPSNVMIDQRGEPLLLDFGLAKRETGELTHTYDGQVFGTAAYMSPEQAEGKGHWTDARSDLYSLGVILFELLTSELPYRGNFERQLYDKQHDDALDPRKLNRNVPQDLATISLKCLERDPNGRYRSAKIVAAELQRFLGGEPIHARPLSRMRRGWRWAKRKPALASALFLTLMVAIAGPIVALIIRSQSIELAGNLQE
ncbi:MAG: serine/threonine-protein kinase [Pirellulales bacterium]